MERSWGIREALAIGQLMLLVGTIVWGAAKIDAAVDEAKHEISAVTQTLSTKIEGLGANMFALARAVEKVDDRQDRMDAEVSAIKAREEERMKR